MVVTYASCNAGPSERLHGDQSGHQRAAASCLRLTRLIPPKFPRILIKEFYFNRLGGNFDVSLSLARKRGPSLYLGCHARFEGRAESSPFTPFKIFRPSLRRFTDLLNQRQFFQNAAQIRHKPQRTAGDHTQPNACDSVAERL